MTPAGAAVQFDRPARDFRGATLAGALALAVGAQALLAFLYGSAPMSARDSWTGGLSLFLLLALPAAGVIWATWRARSLSFDWRMGLAIAAAGALMRVVYLGAGPLLEDDHFRYLLDGAMVANGFSPYAYAPEALLRGAAGAPQHVVDAGRTAIAAINFPDLRTIYPGGAQALFALAYFIAPWSLDGLRIVLFGAEALTAALIWRLLAMSGRRPHLVALYWCNPLAAFCLTGQAHVDAALSLPVLAALLAVHRRRGLLAGACLGFAVGVKLWPILLAPLAARALWPDRRALAAFTLALGASTLALCGPLVWASLSANAGLVAYAGSWSVNNAPYAWASYGFLQVAGPGVGEIVLRGAIMIAAAGASLAVAMRSAGDLGALLGRAAALAAILFYLSPAQFPWYAAWFLPLAAVSGRWALAAASVGLPIYYLFFPLADSGLLDLHRYWVAGLHLAPVIAVMLLLRKRSASGAPA